MRKLFNTTSDNAAELVTEASGMVLPWLRAIRKLGELAEQEVDIVVAERKKELFPAE